MSMEGVSMCARSTYYTGHRLPAAVCLSDYAAAQRVLAYDRGKGKR